MGTNQRGLLPGTVDLVILQTLNVVADFLKESSVSFESAGASGRFFFSESFKLTLLRETVVTIAPEAKADAAETAAGVIDKLLEVDAVAGEAETDIEVDDDNDDGDDS